MADTLLRSTDCHINELWPPIQGSIKIIWSEVVGIFTIFFPSTRQSLGIIFKMVCSKCTHPRKKRLTEEFYKYSKLKVYLHFSQVSWRKDRTQRIIEEMSKIISLNKVYRHIAMFMYTRLVQRFRGKVTESLICDKFWQTEKNISLLLKTCDQKQWQMFIRSRQWAYESIIILLFTQRRILMFREVK